MGHVINNSHEKVRISVPLPPNELTQVAVHYRSVCAALALILHLVDVPERFDGLCVSSSRWIHKVCGMINVLPSPCHERESKASESSFQVLRPNIEHFCTK